MDTRAAAKLDAVTGGRPLPAAERSFFEPRLGTDLAAVRVHDGAAADDAARSVGALAYTRGEDVVFRHGQFRPGTAAGQRLLAHELAHVVQQRSVRSGGGDLIQRQDDGGAPTGGIGTHPAPTMAPATSAPPSQLTRIEAPPVQRILMSCTDMRLRLETGTTAYIYTLETCSLPLGSYETTVTVTGNDFHLDFGQAAQAGQEFEFTYRVEPGQENPAVLLRDQRHVHVDVVDTLPAPPPPQPRPPEEERRTPQCVIRLDERELVRPDSMRRDLFKPLSFERTIWSHSVPLGQFGWVDLDAVASGRLSGTFAASYGPGRLTDICLGYLIDRQSSTAPISHPLVGGGSRADVTTYAIGGQARFRLPARAVIRLAGEGRLRISGDYLSVIEVAAAEGVLTAQGEATLAGEIDGRVEIVARATRSQATLQAPIGPIAVVIRNSTIDGVDLAAEVGLRGRAGLSFRVDLSAAFELAGINLWRQSWNLLRFNPGIDWSGRFKYSPNPGVRWDLGRFGRAAQLEDVEGLDGFRDEAELNEDEIVDSVLDEQNAQITAPDGLARDRALAFDWHKPIELYPATLDIPNADDPKELSRGNGPTDVRYTVGQRTVHERIGVARGNWPSQGKRFQYVPHAGREEPEKNRLRGLLDRLGYDRSGTDVDHVHELQFGGADRFNNLWPADNSGNRSAGARHEDQLSNYRGQFPNLAGRWFVITRIGI